MAQSPARWARASSSTKRRMADDRLVAGSRAASMSAIIAAIGRSRRPAMRRSSSQKRSSTLIEVAWPLMATERLTIMRGRRRDRPCRRPGQSGVGVSAHPACGPRRSVRPRPPAGRPSACRGAHDCRRPPAHPPRAPCACGRCGD
ncbi:hypothetical protein SI859A1_01228 [Aurantimonas manganoxydans SI85-9A1]|uniref:Uncharacterized protein n=1 Tax=Aurantimonas manganoxydans (strain ATCC BAA-1229 / DSM 21871 / SI85-9A1) TaxID=287752 RepID=Q1YJ91_AURMS|nr:hypothetical protein SI859A1_01228 [Aurantimonas manganoxydans SI85-9A1]